MVHGGGGHTVHIHPVTGQLRTAQRGKLVIVIAADRHIPGDLVAGAVQFFHQIEGDLVTVADEGFGHFGRQFQGNVPPVLVPVLQPPVGPGLNARHEQGPAVAQVTVHDGTGGADTAHKPMRRRPVDSRCSVIW